MKLWKWVWLGGGFAALLALTVGTAVHAQEPVLDACGLAIEDIVAIGREDLEGHISPETVALAKKHLEECINGLVGLPDPTLAQSFNALEETEPKRDWTVKSNWTYDAGGEVALAAGTKGYPHNVGGYLYFTQAEGLEVAECMNDVGAYPPWYASPGAP